jgi:hypothetical protein
MKRKKSTTHIVQALAAVAVIILFAACGNKAKKGVTEDGKIDVGEVVKDALQEAAEKNSFSLDAAKYYMKAIGGVDFDKITPDFAYVPIDDASKNCYGDKSHAVVLFVKTDSTVTKEDYQAWVRKVFEVTAAASDDKYNIHGFEFNTQKALEKLESPEGLFDQWLQGWGFRYAAYKPAYQESNVQRVVYVSQEYRNGLHYGVKLDIAVGLAKSLSESMKDAEEVLKKMQ